jgi:hypothetical protein
MLKHAAVLGLVMAAIGCAATDGEDAEASSADLAQASVLRMNQFQAKGTHNSYHDMRWWMPVTALRYDMQPLDVQLEKQGVRAFELDLQFTKGHFEVHHIDTWDAGSTCPSFTDCLAKLKGWSDAHPKHEPLFVQLEAKDDFDASNADAYQAALDQEILSVWPKDRIVTPDDVKGAAASVKDAITTTGWPTMESARGKIVFFLQPDEGRRSYYTHGDHDLDGRLMFVNSGLDRPYAAITILDTPSDPRIPAAVKAGFIVRTRADADVEEAISNDHTHEEAAWASGAQIVSTDFPVEVSNYDYFVTLPGGTVSRCNPVNAPAGCTPAMVESLGSEKKE